MCADSKEVIRIRLQSRNVSPCGQFLAEYRFWDNRFSRQQKCGGGRLLKDRAESLWAPNTTKQTPITAERRMCFLFDLYHKKWLRETRTALITEYCCLTDTADLLHVNTVTLPGMLKKKKAKKQNMNRLLSMTYSTCSFNAEGKKQFFQLHTLSIVWSAADYHRRMLFGRDQNSDPFTGTHHVIQSNTYSHINHILRNHPSQKPVHFPSNCMQLV